MGREELIDCFHDTLDMANSRILKNATIKCQKSNRIYKENFLSKVPMRNEEPAIFVESSTTFATAQKYAYLGKTAVLNFANPENPGGGVHFGAMAQEECLCRSSNLYSCLSSSNVYEDYYAYHRRLKTPFYTDRLIYTKDIIVFKDDSDIPQIMSRNKWFSVDVITCAAPYFAKCKYVNIVELLQLFKDRIKNIVEAARDNDVAVLVLGAFGCGAFKNPPQIVAEAFRYVLYEQGYLQCFKQVVFAIKPISKNCPNLSAFSTVFDIRVPDSVYVMKNSNIKSVFYPDILRLTIESTGEIVEYQKEIVTVGRSPDSDLCLAGKYLARYHATFLYEHKMWFLRSDATNGIWINGIKLMCGLKYQLVANDEIYFPKSEKVIFYKYG